MVTKKIIDYFAINEPFNNVFSENEADSANVSGIP